MNQSVLAIGSFSVLKSEDSHKTFSLLFDFVIVRGFVILCVGVYFNLF